MGFSVVDAVYIFVCYNGQKKVVLFSEVTWLYSGCCVQHMLKMLSKGEIFQAV